MGRTWQWLKITLKDVFRSWSVSNETNNFYRGHILEMFERIDLQIIPRGHGSNLTMTLKITLEDVFRSRSVCNETNNFYRDHTPEMFEIIDLQTILRGQSALKLKISRCFSTHDQKWNIVWNTSHLSNDLDPDMMGSDRPWIRIIC